MQGTLGEWWEHYAATKTDWSPRTREERLGLWDRHIAPVFAHKRLGDITTTSVRSWHSALHAVYPATAQGAYRLLRQTLYAAVVDNRLVRNPCQVKGAGVDEAPERRPATVAEVEVIVAEMPERMRLLVLPAMWATLSRSELLGLRRFDVDLVHRTVTVAETAHHLKDGRVMRKGPKAKARGRTVSFPSSIADDVAGHLARFVRPEPMPWCSPGKRASRYVRTSSGPPTAGLERSPAGPT
jgi:integrase